MVTEYVGTRRTASLLIQFAAQKTMKTDLNKWFGESERSTKGKKVSFIIIYA